jgi:NADH:ubiquinone oxidoreductase subunit 3 (subunit A)
MSAESLIIFFIVAAFLVGAAILFSSFVPPTSINVQKAEPYECGIPTIGVSWLQFNIGYYLFAILYLIFDVEIVFLLPWATVMRELGMVAFVEILIFLLILGLGLLYAWNKKALVWE